MPTVMRNRRLQRGPLACWVSGLASFLLPLPVFVLCLSLSLIQAWTFEGGGGRQRATAVREGSGGRGWIRVDCVPAVTARQEQMGVATQ